MPLELHDSAVSDLIWNAGAAFRDRYARKGVNLLADPRRGAGYVVSVDAQRMAQVLSNLLANALRHTAPGGTVQLSAQVATDSVTLTVHDTGEGIPADALPHLFERFYRGDTARDRDHGGAGIGLTISRAITEAHGGRLAAYSDGPNMGAEFAVVLPARPKGRRD